MYILQICMDVSAIISMGSHAYYSHSGLASLPDTALHAIERVWSGVQAVIRPDSLIGDRTTEC